MKPDDTDEFSSNSTPPCDEAIELLLAKVRKASRLTTSVSAIKSHQTSPPARLVRSPSSQFPPPLQAIQRQAGGALRAALPYLVHRDTCTSEQATVHMDSFSTPPSPRARAMHRAEYYKYIFSMWDSVSVLFSGRLNGAGRAVAVRGGGGAI